MITCYVQYQIDPDKLADFETYARLWMPLVEEFGGTHHGYFLPYESANDLALTLFSFTSLAAYESYRTASLDHPGCQAAYEYARSTGCIKRYDRQFLKPIFPEIAHV